MPKETFYSSPKADEVITLSWGDRHTQIGVRYDGGELFADLDYSDIDRLIKSLRRAKRSRLKDYQEQ